MKICINSLICMFKLTKFLQFCYASNLTFNTALLLIALLLFQPYILQLYFFVL